MTEIVRDLQERINKTITLEFDDVDREQVFIKDV